MSVRFSATGQSFASTSNLPGASGYTATFWLYLTTNRVAVSGFFGIDGASGTHTLSTKSDGTGFQCICGGATSSFGLAGGYGSWIRVALAFSSVTTAVTGTLYYATPIAATLTASSIGTGSGIGTPSAWRLGCGAVTTDWMNGRLAGVKIWTALLTASEIDAELKTYRPQRTANLVKWYPFLATETTDYSGNAATLTGGVGTATESNPPLSWRHGRNTEIPWDSTTQIFYVLYDSTTGELISTGSVDPSPAPAGTGILQLLGAPPDESAYEWSTTARDYVRRAAVIVNDRVADLLADGTLTAAWAALSGAQSQAMQDRIGQMLGPYRYRDPADSIDIT
jgi:hypothetical protein